MLTLLVSTAQPPPAADLEEWLAAGVSVVFSEWLLMSLRHRNLAPLETHEVTNLNASRSGSPSFPRTASGSRSSVTDDRKTPGALRLSSQNQSAQRRRKTLGDAKRNAYVPHHGGARRPAAGALEKRPMWSLFFFFLTFPTFPGC